MPRLANADVAHIFAQLATMLELDEANPFRVRAYREAARVIGSLARPVADLAPEKGALEELPGIGKDLAQKIRDILATGTLETYEKMAEKYPPELVRLTELQGLGAKRVRLMYETLGVHDRVSLEAAARAGKLREVRGLGEKFEQNVLHALAIYDQVSGRILLSRAFAVAEALEERLKTVPGVKRVEAAGSFRRRKETVGDLDLLVCGGAPDAVMESFTTHHQVAEVLGRGDTKSSVRLSDGMQVDLRVVPEESFGAALLYFTGSKEHNIELRRMANERGLTLNEYGLAREKDKKVVSSRTEEEIYRALGCDWIPPELRECHGEIALSREHRLPKLIELEDLKGDLHMHTDRTDGRQTIAEMARAAQSRGYEYVAMTEHSKALAMARGFDEARVRQSVKEIDAARREVPGIEILHGLEVDILADGALDLRDEALALLDWVVVSLHSRLSQSAEEATPRVMKALDHPAVSAMGHPTGRMIGTRPPVPFDLEKAFAVAAERGVAMEMNAQPDRMDLSDVNARRARDMGVGLVICTDAHSIANLDLIRCGIFAARRAGFTKDDVLNTLPWERFRKTIRNSHSHPKGPSEAQAQAKAAPVVSEAKPALRATAPPAAAPAAAAKKPAGKAPAAGAPSSAAKKPAREMPARSAPSSAAKKPARRAPAAGAKKPAKRR